MFPRLKVALFGGTFDPPHRAHQAVAASACKEFALDQVWWIPSWQPPHKTASGISSFEHRFAMVRLACERHASFCASDLERGRPGPSYTVDTVTAARAAHPRHAFWLLLGEDSLHQLHRWYAPERIVAQIPLLVYRRAGLPSQALDSGLRAEVVYCSAPPVTGSGTVIRSRVAQGATIGHLVCESVGAYIEAHRLYQR